MVQKSWKLLQNKEKYMRWYKFWRIILKSSSCITSHKVTGGSKSSPWKIRFTLISCPFCCAKLPVRHRPLVGLLEMCVLQCSCPWFVLFCVPQEGGGTIASPLLTFAGTDCNVSGSFPVSKHISSERHKESNSVYPCKTLLSYNTERWTSLIV